MKIIEPQDVIDKGLPELVEGVDQKLYNEYKVNNKECRSFNEFLTKELSQDVASIHNNIHEKDQISKSR